jgi:hypothetical protein
MQLEQERLIMNEKGRDDSDIDQPLVLYGIVLCVVALIIL